ncbi:MAG: DUF2332 family protein [Pseudomonadota bacterium]
MPGLTGARHAFVRQAETCRASGSEFVAAVLEAVDRHLSAAPRSNQIVQHWRGDPAAGAVALRVNGALHALARRGQPAYLSALYQGEHTDFDGAVGQALAQEDAFIAEWMRYPTQTNEVARGAAIMSALMAIAAEQAMPFEILELGSSCGLNLNLARYSYRLGNLEAGERASPVRIAPRWSGADPPDAQVRIIAAQGVDLNPLDATDPAHRERLLSFTWADQPARSRRLEAALQVARTHPPQVHQGDARLWLTQRLAERQSEDTCRVVLHTMFVQYLSLPERGDIAKLLEAAGAGSTGERPLYEIGLEWTADRGEVQLRATRWPEGCSKVLAICHPYCEWVEWLGFT